MSNNLLTLLTIAVFGGHLAVLALGLMRRGRPAVLWLSGGEAAVVLAWLALHPMALRPPIDWAVAGLAAFEVAVLAAVAMSIRGVRAATVAVWVAFAAHLVMSGLALAFALFFRMNRLF